MYWAPMRPSGNTSYSPPRTSSSCDCGWMFGSTSILVAPDADQYWSGAIERRLESARAMEMRLSSD